MIQRIFWRLKFIWFSFRLKEMYWDFVGLNECAPHILLLNAEVLDFFYLYFAKNGFFGEFNFEVAWDAYFKVGALRRSKEIKFARYE